MSFKASAAATTDAKEDAASSPTAATMNYIGGRPSAPPPVTIAIAGATSTTTHPSKLSHSSRNPLSRRFSLNTVPGAGSPSFHNIHAKVEGKVLNDLTVFELLDVLKSLGCPLKARKCLDHVGVSGKDFSYYKHRDLEQIGVRSAKICERTLAIKDAIIEDNNGRIPPWLLNPMGKRQRIERDAQIYISDVG